METIEQINEQFDVKKPKNKKKILITIMIMLIIIIALIFTCFIAFARPQYVFCKAIDKIFGSKKEAFESVKLDYKFKASVDTTKEEIKEYTKDLEKYSLNLGTQIDVKSKQEIVDLGLDYNKEEVIKAQVYYYNENMYVYLNDLFDKYIELDIPADAKKSLEDVFEMIGPEQQKKSMKMQEILRDEIKNQIKEEGKFVKEKTTIEINGKEQNVTNYTLELSQEALINIICNMFTNLSENEEFLECFEDEIVKSDLKDAAKTLEENKKEIDEEIVNIKVNLYTKGLMNKFVGGNIELNITADSQRMKTVFNIIKEEKDKYSYKVKLNSLGVDIELLSGIVEIQKEKDTKKEQKGKLIITAKIAMLELEAKLEMDYLGEYNKQIDKIDIVNSVNINELTEEDMKTIMEKLEKKPLIGELVLGTNEELVEKAEEARKETEIAAEKEKLLLAVLDAYDVEMGVIFENIKLPEGFKGENGIYTSTKTGKKYIIDKETGKISEEIKEEQGEINKLQNEIKDESIGYAVIYLIPDEFENIGKSSVDFGTTHYYSLKNIDSSIQVEIGIYNKEKYKKEVIDVENDNYKKMYSKSSKIHKTITSYEKDFDCTIIESHSSDKDVTQSVFITYDLDDNNVFAVEFKTSGEKITEDYMKEFLQILVKKI